MMRRLASVVALFLLLSSAAPVLACLTGASMSHEESECCRAMHGKCGEMATMGCCRIEVRHDPPQQITQVTAVPVHWVIVSLPGVAAVSIDGHLRMSLKLRDAYSPPGMLAVESTVLRI